MSIKNLAIYITMITLSVLMTNATFNTVLADALDGDIVEIPSPDDSGKDLEGTGNLNWSGDTGNKDYNQTETSQQDNKENNQTGTSQQGKKDDPVIKIAKTKVLSAVRTSKKAKIKLKKIKGATGYQIKYSTSKKIKAPKTKKKTFKKNKFLLKKLKPEKKYYIKARAYKMEKGVKVYGEWSSPKVIKKKN